MNDSIIIIFYPETSNLGRGFINVYYSMLLNIIREFESILKYSESYSKDHLYIKTTCP